MGYNVYDISECKAIEATTWGARSKNWLNVKGHPWLFKIPKQDTAEHIVEKITCELCNLLPSIPHARIELATRNGQLGSMSQSVLVGHPDKTLHEFRSLVKDGNRWSSSSNRTIYAKYGAVYNIDTVTQTVNNLSPNLVVYFIRAILFDFLIGNNDRHHGNWGILKNPATGEVVFSPLYDSGSGLCSTKPEATVKKLLARGDFLNQVRSGSSVVRHGNVRNSNFASVLKELRKEYPQLFISFASEVHNYWTDANLQKIIRDVGTYATEDRKLLMYELLKASRNELINRAMSQ